MARRLRSPFGRLRCCASARTAPASDRGLGPPPLLMGWPSPLLIGRLPPWWVAAAEWYAAISPVFVGGVPPVNPRRY